MAALSANATHGLKRSNSDKRRCVEIALKEWPKLSARRIAEMCGVHVDMVIARKPAQVSESDTSKVTGKDGKEYPAHRNTTPRPDPCPEARNAPTLPQDAITEPEPVVIRIANYEPEKHYPPLIFSISVEYPAAMCM